MKITFSSLSKSRRGMDVLPSTANMARLSFGHRIPALVTFIQVGHALSIGFHTPISSLPGLFAFWFLRFLVSC